MRFKNRIIYGQPESGREVPAGLRGFSLLEGLIVLGLIAIIVAVVLPNFMRILQGYRLQTSAQQIAINLRFARNAAVKQKVNYRVTFRNQTHGTSPNTYFFEHSPSGTYVPYRKIDVSLPKGVLIKSGSVSQLEFDSRGRSTPSGVIRLEGKDGTQYEVSVSLNGGVSTEKV